MSKLQTPNLTKRYDRMWCNVVNKPDGNLVYTEIAWTAKKRGWITMNRELYEKYREWSRSQEKQTYFKDFAEEFGLTSFILTPEGKVKLTADIPPRNLNENS